MYQPSLFLHVVNILYYLALSDTFSFCIKQNYTKHTNTGDSCHHKQYIIDMIEDKQVSYVKGVSIH